MSSSVNLEDFMPLPKAVREGLTVEDRFIVSFPRSGRTWMMRSMVCVAKSQALNHPLDEKFISEEIVHSRGTFDLNLSDESWENPNIESSIRLPFVAHGWSGLPEDTLPSNLILIRSPSDVLVSYYNFATTRNFVDDQTVSREEFVIGNLPWWLAHTEEALHRLERGKGHWKVMSYERFLQDPARNLSAICRLFDLKGPVEACRFALETITPHFSRSHFSNYAYLEGRPGRGSQELEGDLLALIEETAMPLYREVCHHEAAWPKHS